MVKTSADGRSRKTWFQVVQAGTASYAAGGFTIAVPDVSKIVSAAIFMTPETLIANATTSIVGLILSYTGKVATVKVCEIDHTTNAWGEVANTTNLSGANFILSGEGF